jgi:surface protein
MNKTKGNLTESKHILRGMGVRLSHILTAAFTLALLLLPGEAKADNEAWAEYDSLNAKLTFKYGERPVKPADGVVAYSLNTPSDDSDSDSYPAWSEHSEDITTVEFDPTFADARPTTCEYWFELMEGLAEVRGIENLNTENVTSMKGMFADCIALTSLDLSGLNTSKVTTMQDMFNCCISLKTLNLSGLDTGNVTDMRNIFSYCTSLKTLLLDGFDTSNVEFMDYMFSDCESLETLDVSSFNTANATRMINMFDNCTSLTSLDVTHFDTSNVEDMELMFSSCESLTTLDLSNFNTANVTYMKTMFYGCSSLTTLDLSSFNTEKVKDMDYMFTDCSQLQTIYVSDKFKTSSVKYSKNMFSGCSDLTGAVGYDANSTDVAKANYTNGYFKTYYRVGDGDKEELFGETLSTDELALEDGKDFVAYAPFKAASASYSRTMPGNWGTLCLPFAVETSAVSGCSFYEIESGDDTSVTFARLDGTIAAGTPVLVYSGNKGFSITESDVAVVEEPVAATQKDGYQLVGSFVETELTDADFILSKNKFWDVTNLKAQASASSVKVKGQRAWLKNGTTALEAKAPALDITLDDAGETDAIDAVNALLDGTAETYDMQGRRTDGLQKGLNIVRANGMTRKIMVK